MHNKDEIAKYIAELTHSEIKKLCVQCGKSPDFISKDSVEKAVCSVEVKAMLEKFAKMPNTKIIVEKVQKSIYEYFANHLYSKIGVKYEMIKALETRKCESKMAINAQQRKLCKIYLQKAKMQSVLEIISSEKSSNS
ncbi:hypothetical protein [Helicobacter macacae]|uniref:Uncharacterized protein n=1 Tax=Helicobacter macacae MIT 99-5501 TaxID=1357400 RepID=V8C861_9HELI|nr:hypothetical protein [Helicobacter macacae]ETD23534.1 hypothetical protein HMPREF2086_01339 [Helicobacter macacae MIT 99-5501]